jgi:hypothetical protein
MRLAACDAEHLEGTTRQQRIQQRGAGLVSCGPLCDTGKGLLLGLAHTASSELQQGAAMVMLQGVMTTGRRRS